MWTLDEESERAIRNMPVLMREAGIEDETVEFWRLWMNALRAGNPKMPAYLSYMVQRLVVRMHCAPWINHWHMRRPTGRRRLDAGTGGLVIQAYNLLFRNKMIEIYNSISPKNSRNVTVNIKG